jgi:hypothetical protein
MVIFVPSMICDIVPISLARIWATTADGSAMAENATIPKRIMSRV